MTVLGAVLAGGNSGRFGSDKALALWRGQSLMEAALEAVGTCADDMVVCGRPWPGARCVTDRPATGLGPLGGLNAALHHARTHGHALVLCAPVDVVPLGPALACLLAHDAPAVIAGQRVIGLWPVSLAAALDAYLACGERSVRGWVAGCGAKEIALAAPLRNINRPVDLGD